MAKTVNWLLLKYFSERLNLSSSRSIHFAGHVVEGDIPAWAKREHGVLHTPSTFARGFRAMREKHLYPDNWTIEESMADSVEKIYTIRYNPRSVDNETIFGNSGI